MNTSLKNNIRSLSTAGYLWINLVTFVKQCVGQAVLIGLCFALLLFPEFFIVVATVAIFITAWFGGQHVGGEMVRNYGVEYSRFFVRQAWKVFKLNLLGTFVALLLGAVLVYTFMGEYVLLAYLFVNGSIGVWMCLVALEVASVEPEPEEMEE